MTVTYTARVATVKFKTLWILLARWRGSVYKNTWKDAVLFFGLYFSLSILYRFILTDPMKSDFERMVMYCNKMSGRIPVAFILGFYVSVVVRRWWDQLNEFMPWPDSTAVSVTAFVHGTDEKGRLMRRTIMRYVNLAWILCLCSISTVAKKRFPSLDHLVETGMMTKGEKEIFENIKCPSNKYFIPIIWATTLLGRARKEERVHSDVAKLFLVQQIMRFRSSCGTLFNYDWLSFPLVYTQVVTIAVHAYFINDVIGQQFLDPKKGYPGKEVDIYIPIFLMLEFLFYMGWLKCAESLLNPFGEDDDDFDTNWVLDRNIQVSYLIVDELHSEIPELIKDAYWDSVDILIPYTAAAEASKVAPYLGSTNEMELKQEDTVFLPLSTVMEEEDNGSQLAEGQVGQDNSSRTTSVHSTSRQPWKKRKTFLSPKAGARSQRTVGTLRAKDDIDSKDSKASAHPICGSVVNFNLQKGKSVVLNTAPNLAPASESKANAAANQPETNIDDKHVLPNQPMVGSNDAALHNTKTEMAIDSKQDNRAAEPEVHEPTTGLKAQVDTKRGTKASVLFKASKIRVADDENLVKSEQPCVIDPSGATELIPENLVQKNLPVLHKPSEEETQKDSLSAHMSPETDTVPSPDQDIQQSSSHSHGTPAEPTPSARNQEDILQDGLPSQDIPNPTQPEEAPSRNSANVTMVDKEEEPPATDKNQDNTDQV